MEVKGNFPKGFFAMTPKRGSCGRYWSRQTTVGMEMAKAVLIRVATI